MNKQLNLPALQNIMREFEKQNERMEMTTEVRNMLPSRSAQLDEVSCHEDCA
jgi:division protein CdvB (Snf7/Vps24/ESCRT-III family)